MRHLNNSRKKFILFTVLLILLAVSGTAQAQTTSFSYQGKLDDGGNPASGAYDFEFRLFDALSGGTQIGSTFTVNDLNVATGIFTTTLDFGAAAFPGANRWLQISVRPGASTGAYTTLTPRQQVLSTSYAIKSLNAAAADSLSAACVGCVTNTQIGSLPTGSGNYIQNTNTQQASSNFNISGNGTAAGTLTGNIVSATTQYNIGTSRILGNSGIGNLFAGINAGVNTTGGSNAFFGNNAGQTNTTGGSNAFFGSRAGASNTTGTGNAFFGEGAGLFNTTGGFNSFYGTLTGQVNTMGGSNSFFGSNAGLANTTGNGNSFYGAGAGQSNTTGEFNDFFGVNTGASNTTGTLNSFFGNGAGVANTTGSSNAFFGRSAGAANTTGGSNSFFGRFAGAANTTANANSFFGALAGRNNTTGVFNSFFGADAGLANNTGNSNSFFGVEAGQANTTASQNSFFGDRAGIATTTGGSNSFFGADAGLTNSTGSVNTFVGVEAGFSNTTGSTNVMVGWRSGKSNTVGTENTFTGVGAGEGNTTGSNNTFIGRSAGISNAAGIRNSFYGYKAGHNTAGGISEGEFPAPFGHSNTFAGAEAGSANTTGSFNTFIGDIAGITNIIGNSNTYLGYNARGNAGSSNTTAIGSDAFANCNSCVILGRNSDRVGIGTSNPNVAYKLDVTGIVNASGGYQQVSDQRYKTNIQPLAGALNKVRQLRGVSYQWQQSAFPEMQFSARPQIGFIAQEAEAVLPEAVTKDSRGHYSMSYTTVIPLLVEAIKEQQQQTEAANAAKDKQLEQLRQENASLRQRLEAIEKALEKIVNK